MPEVGRFRRRLRWRLWKVPVEEEVSSELEFHLEMLVRENVARGMDPAAAREAALRRFGDVGAVNAVCRDIGRRRDDEMRRAEWMLELRQDVRYALRQLRASPGFTAVALLTLALGIGTSTTIFGVADAVLLRPLPYPAPERLVRIWETNPTTQFFSTSEPNFLDWRARARGFEALAAYTSRSVSIVGDGEPERYTAGVVTPSFFPILGTRPLLGRTFAEDEAAPGGAAARVAVLTYGFWQRRFGGDPRVVGTTVALDGTAHEVIGVLPADFRFPRQADVWLPLPLSAASPRGDHRLGAIGRLKPGVTAEQALAELQGVQAQLAREYPQSNADWGANVATFAEWIVDRELRTRVVALLVAVGLLLLMACVNVASLLLARASSRQHELGVRAALGAGRGRIVRQLLTESTVLSLLGAAAGVALALAAVPALRDVGAAAVPRLEELRVDWRVLAFGVGASLLTGFLFGLAPVRALINQGPTNNSLNQLLRAGGRAGSAGTLGAGRLRAALVVTSVAMALLLLVGAGLVGGSFLRLMRVETGFRADDVLTASVALPAERYPTNERRAAFWAELERRLAAVPGVAAAGATNIAPFSGGNTASEFSVVGRDGSEFQSANWRSVTPGYFAALGIPLLRGRTFTDADGDEKAPLQFVITKTMADRVFPGEDPVGKQLYFGRSRENRWTVIGVVGDVRDVTLETEPAPMLYLPTGLAPWPSMWIVARSAAGDPLSLAGVLRREVWALDKQLPVADLQPLDRLQGEIAAQPRLTMMVFALFAAAALTLAVVGLYGIVAYSVTQRTREIGVRLALGARPSQIVRRVVRHGIGLAALGIVVGLGASYALSRYIANILYGVEPTDATTYAGVALLLAACAALASAVPARWAARLDPVRALRD